MRKLPVSEKFVVVTVLGALKKSLTNETEEQFAMSVLKPKPRYLVWLITKDADNTDNQSKLDANTRSRREARENERKRV